MKENFCLEVISSLSYFPIHFPDVGVFHEFSHCFLFAFLDYVLVVVLVVFLLYLCIFDVRSVRIKHTQYFSCIVVNVLAEEPIFRQSTFKVSVCGISFYVWYTNAETSNIHAKRFIKWRVERKITTKHWLQPETQLREEKNN